VAWHWPFKAVVADSFYGEDATVRAGLQQLGVGYVLALKPSHSWWHPRDELGSLDEVARTTPWQATAPGAWQAVDRTFRDGHLERWWALEIKAGPYGGQRRERAVVATTDPATLPELSTWYLVTNLPATHKPRAARGPRVGAPVAEIVRLYGLRAWVEQSYKQVKTTLGWAQYQVRSSRAIQRHWILVYCAFTLCWWQAAQEPAADGLVGDPAHQPSAMRRPAPLPGQQKSRCGSGPTRTVVARRTPASAQLAGASHHAQALLARLLAVAPAASASSSP
jgi:Transposase DDE domain